VLEFKTISNVEANTLLGQRIYMRKSAYIAVYAELLRLMQAESDDVVVLALRDRKEAASFSRAVHIFLRRKHPDFRASIRSGAVEGADGITVAVQVQRRDER